MASPLSLVLACLLPFTGTLQAGGTSVETVSALLSKTAGVHPRLFLHAADVDGLKGKINADPQLVQVRAELIARSEKILSIPPATRIMTGKRLLSVSRACFQKHDCH